MIAVYAVAIVLGIVSVLAWIFMGLAASSMHDMSRLDPEERFGEKGRYLVAGLMGFGMGGMSASFGGWNDALAVLAAIAGLVAAVVAARYLGVEEDQEQDPA